MLRLITDCIYKDHNTVERTSKMGDLEQGMMAAIVWFYIMEVVMVALLKS